jgi:hypothetical protein
MVPEAEDEKAEVDKKGLQTVETGGRQDQQQDGAADEAGKVVRIPRDWFGPAEDLVPLGPRASAPGDQLDPNTFWDESSNDIQHVVEAPAEKQNDGWFRRSVPVRLVDHLPRGVGARKLVATVVVALIVAAGVAGSLLGNPRGRQHRSAIASIKPPPTQSPARFLGRSTAPIEGRSGLSVRLKAKAKPKVRVNHRETPGGRTSGSTATPVVYRTTQTNFSAAPDEPGNSAASATSGQSGVSSGAATPSSPHPANQSAQPAFGANGALGPMSSPDG